LVNEITPDGTVVHLQNLHPPKHRHQQVEFSAVPEPVMKAEEPAAVATIKVEEPVASVIVQKADSDTISEPDEIDGGVKLVPQSAEANGKSTAETSTTSGDVKAVPEISAADIELLDSCFGADIRETIIRMYHKILAKPDAKPNFFGSVFSRPITDKQLRTKMHSVRYCLPSSSKT
jgi:tRNA pseudouridine13 synthase